MKNPVNKEGQEIHMELKSYSPKKGDKVKLFNGKKIENGVILDNDFYEIEWENGDIEQWCGDWHSFLMLGGYINKD